LRYREGGADRRFGRIEFAIGADVTPEFKKAALTEVSRKEWQPPCRRSDGHRIQTSQEWAEVCFIPNAISHRLDAPVYRYLAIRDPLGSMDLPGMPRQELPFPTLRMDLQQYKRFSLVTNMDWDGERLIHWRRERCGKSGEAHSAMYSLKLSKSNGGFPRHNFPTGGGSVFRNGHATRSFGGSSLKCMGNQIRDMIEIRHQEMKEVDTDHHERHGFISVGIGFDTAMACGIV
jgi:hypothetical protein